MGREQRGSRRVPGVAPLLQRPARDGAEALPASAADGRELHRAVEQRRVVLLLREPVERGRVVHLGEVLFSRTEEPKDVLVGPVAVRDLAVQLDGLGVPGPALRFSFRFSSLVEALRALLALLLGAQFHVRAATYRVVVERVERRDQQR